MSGAQDTFTISLVPPMPSVTPSLGVGCGRGPFAGLPQTTLRAALLQAQQALIAVGTGAKPVSVSYAEGQGHRQVSYTRTNCDELRGLIRDLQAALGMRTRRAIGVRIP